MVLVVAAAANGVLKVRREQGVVILEEVGLVILVLLAAAVPTMLAPFKTMSPV